MKISKKSSLYAMLLLIVASNVAYGMDKPQKIGGWKKRAQWAVNVGEVALGFKPVSSLMAQKKTAPSDFSTSLPTLEPKEFTDLPKEMQNKILGIVIAGQNASDLQEAAMTIDALAGVNQELNSLFNDPQFCLKTIKDLAKRFNDSDEMAAKVLGIKSAKERLALQRKLREAIESKKSSTEDLLSLIQQGADVNFTVTAYHVPTYWFPLAQICITHTDYDLDKKNDGLKKLAVLLENGTDPKLRNSLGQTLIEVAQKHDNKEAIELFEKHSQ